jgi:hypothetical protein
MPKADATELAPKKIGYNPPAWRRCAGGHSFSPTAFCFDHSNRTRLPKTINPKNSIFFGEAPERRPWATKREDRPAAFAGRCFFGF